MNKIIQISALAIVLIILGYFAINSGPSRLAQGITGGINYNQAKYECVRKLQQELNTDRLTDEDIQKIKAAICKFHKLPRDCEPTEKQVREWLEDKVEKCAKDKTKS